MNTNSIKPFSQRNINSSPNFKGVNLVQVSKKAFADPKNTQSCFDTFTKVVTEAMGTKKVNNILSFRNIKTVMYPETPPFSFITGVLQKLGFGGCSVDWFAKNTGANIKGELSPDFKSFFILTGKEKDKVNKIFSPQNAAKTYAQAVADFSRPGGLNEKQTNALQQLMQAGDKEALQNKSIMIIYAKMAEMIDSQTEAAIKGAPFKSFQGTPLMKFKK